MFYFESLLVFQGKLAEAKEFCQAFTYFELPTLAQNIYIYIYPIRTTLKLHPQDPRLQINLLQQQLDEYHHFLQLRIQNITRVINGNDRYRL